MEKNPHQCQAIDFDDFFIELKAAPALVVSINANSLLRQFHVVDTEAMDMTDEFGYGDQDV